MDNLAFKYKTDKGTRSVNGTSGKGYTLLYEKYFKIYRYAPIRILEIGVKSGASLRMWSEYFPNAEIIGIDINPATKCEVGTIYIGDQTDTDFLESIMDRYDHYFDIIIDDGGHKFEQIRTSFETLIDCVGICYVVEDLHVSGKKFFNYLSDMFALIQGKKTKIKSVHFYKSIAFIWM